MTHVIQADAIHPYRALVLAGHVDQEGVGLARLRRSAGAEEGQGMTRPQFARYYLMRLGIGDDLKRVALNSESPYKLAPVEEVLELHPELRSPG